MNNSENIRRQGESADNVRFQRQLSGLLRYQSEFPDKVTINMDEVIVKDKSHFDAWKNGKSSPIMVVGGGHIRPMDILNSFLEEAKPNRQQRRSQEK
jgi:hypothetical protein